MDPKPSAVNECWDIDGERTSGRVIHVHSGGLPSFRSLATAAFGLATFPTDRCGRPHVGWSVRDDVGALAATVCALRCAAEACRASREVTVRLMAGASLEMVALEALQ